MTLETRGQKLETSTTSAFNKKAKQTGNTQRLGARN
jgi:hypothetical protein